MPEPIPRRKSPRQRKIETSQAFKPGTTERPSISKSGAAGKKSRLGSFVLRARPPSIADGAQGLIVDKNCQAKTVCRNCRAVWRDFAAVIAGGKCSVEADARANSDVVMTWDAPCK